MDNKTIQYKRTLRGSVGAGMSALFNGEGRRYYILEHKDASKYHKAGESQKIIIDQIELGRDGNCQVRYDESFSTVSRRHAAIVKDGERWKLVQLSTTNTTLLNGRPVETEWYLENGDEIQLSVGGPRLGFIVPAGKQSLVSSIRMTERLELFRKQALKPYKTAIVAMFVALVVLSAGAGYVIHNQGVNIKDLLAKAEVQAKILNDARDKWNKDSTEMARGIAHAQETANKNKGKTIVVKPSSNELAAELDKVKSSVYAITAHVYFVMGDKKQEFKLNGTGFLMTDGRFVTARHCVEPWMFDTEMQEMYAMSNVYDDCKIYADVVAINGNNEQLLLKSTSFVIDRSYDTPYIVPFEVDGESFELPGALAFGSKASLGNDWAYARTSAKGLIKDGRAFSSNMKSASIVHVLGFPKNNGRGDGSKMVEPIYNTMTISRDGLNDSRCIMTSLGTDKGNSGGPVFYQKDGTLYCIGIVSHSDLNSKLYDQIVPMSNLK